MDLVAMGIMGEDASLINTYSDDISIPFRILATFIKFASPFSKKKDHILSILIKDTARYVADLEERLSASLAGQAPLLVTPPAAAGRAPFQPRPHLISQQPNFQRKRYRHRHRGSLLYHARFDVPRHHHRQWPARRSRASPAAQGDLAAVKSPACDTQATARPSTTAP